MKLAHFLLHRFQSQFSESLQSLFKVALFQHVNCEVHKPLIVPIPWSVNPLLVPCVHLGMSLYFFQAYRWWRPYFGFTDFNGSAVRDIFVIPIDVIIIIIVTVVMLVFSITAFSIVDQ